MSPAQPTMQLTPAATDFIRGVLALKPRIAVFDCDGTLWAGDSGAEFLYWELAQGLLPPKVADWVMARYEEYKAGNVSEEEMCGEMVSIHEGLSVADLERAAERFFAEKFAGAIFPDMFELIRQLRESGCELWAVSSTNDWVVTVGVRELGIPQENVLAACVHCAGGKATAMLCRVPSGPDKAKAIHECINRIPDVVFGNSIHDAAMLKLARHAFAVNPNRELTAIAREYNWPIYHPMGT
jgi:phosphoserine phosphatase